jgi:iron complex outermembrane receptor protein
MKPKSNWLLKGLGLIASPALILATFNVYGQDSAESAVVNSQDVVSESVSAESLAFESDDDSVDEIVVTGSRLKRSTFSSISPLQIISAGISREAGLVNAADILQTSTSAGGQQVDLTFGGFVLDNGPGTRTINLRGLGANRTLVMINGRRMAPGGAEGAPYAPNVGMVPAGLVSQYELLTDGASSVYGSDAIGGVTNIILKKDFDGLRIEGGASNPKYDGGENTNLALTWGKAWDKGFIGMGFDYNKEEHATYASRPWTNGCETNYEVGSDGSFRTEDLFWENARGAKPTDCKYGAMTGYTSILEGNLWSGLRFYTPGNGNGGIPNFSQFRGPYAGAFYNDTDGDGVADVSWGDYILNGSEANNNAYLYPDYETGTFMSYGEYTFDGDANITAYFETLYSEADYAQLGQPAQFFPTVPANNPYNICNPNAENGVDCGLAEDEFLFGNAGYNAAFLAAQGVTPDVYYGLLANGPIGAVAVQPVVSVVGDRNSSKANYKNLRFVAGLNGDLPGMDFGTLSNWSFDSYISYSRSQGESNRLGIRGDRLDLSLGAYSDTSTPCENNTGEILESDVAPGCVAVNMFAPSLHAIGGVGDFATAAEREYLFDSRDFDTDYEQTVVSGIMGGDIYELPNGPVQLSVGFEYRKDEINSMPDVVARDGLFFGFFADGGAVGSKDSRELFFEVEAPILANKPFAKELVVNASARYTDDEIYGSNTTESVKIGWRPVNSLLVRATYGTAYRAPNLRELYLANQTGFNSIYDPCVVPQEALTGGEIGGAAGSYDPTADPREQEVLDNCLAQGVNPVTFENGGIDVYSVEQGAGGSLTLDPETSTSWTAGFSWEQEFSNEFDFGISSTYYEVDIDNTIIEPSGGYIVGDCYGSETGNSAFCNRITRDSDSTISFINRGFINRDNENGRGVDVNVTFADDISLGDRVVSLTVDVSGNRQIERSTLFINDEGGEDYEDYAEEWGFPAWRVNSTIRLGYEKWRLQLRTNWMSAVDQDPSGIDEFGDIYSTFDVGADTCLGAEYGDVVCRDVGFASAYMYHSLSLSYLEDNWALTLGARNITNEAPPMVDGSEVSSVNNAPIGYGYNLMGRSLYLNFAYDLGSN